MAGFSAEEMPHSSMSFHEYYSQILNAVHDAVYWVDNNCQLKGYNQAFIDMLHLALDEKLAGHPYDALLKYAKWPADRVEAFKFDDMAAIFNKENKVHIKEAVVHAENDKDLYYMSSRVVLLDNQRHVCGLVVVLRDISEIHQLEQQVKKTQLATPKELVKQRTTPVRVLMVEDNPVAQKIEATLFQALNCEVDLAESGETALRLFAPNKYDLVIMDIGLEDTSGYVVTKKIRQIEKDMDHADLIRVPIVALTAYQANIVKYDCKAYMMDGVMTKPISGEQAHQLLQRFVYKKEDVQVHGLQTE